MKQIFSIGFIVLLSFSAQSQTIKFMDAASSSEKEYNVYFEDNSSVKVTPVFKERLKTQNDIPLTVYSLISDTIIINSDGDFIQVRADTCWISKIHKKGKYKFFNNCPLNVNWESSVKSSLITFKNTSGKKLLSIKYQAESEAVIVDDEEKEEEEGVEKPKPIGLLEIKVDKNVYKHDGQFSVKFDGVVDGADSSCILIISNKTAETVSLSFAKPEGKENPLSFITVGAFLRFEPSLEDLGVIVPGEEKEIKLIYTPKTVASGDITIAITDGTSTIRGNIKYGSVKKEEVPPMFWKKLLASFKNLNHQLFSLILLILLLFFTLDYKFLGLLIHRPGLRRIKGALNEVKSKNHENEKSQFSKLSRSWKSILTGLTPEQGDVKEKTRSEFNKKFMGSLSSLSGHLKGIEQGKDWHETERNLKLAIEQQEDSFKKILRKLGVQELKGPLNQYEEVGIRKIQEQDQKYADLQKTEEQLKAQLSHANDKINDLTRYRNGLEQIGVRGHQETDKLISFVNGLKRLDIRSENDIKTLALDQRKSAKFKELSEGFARGKGATPRPLNSEGAIEAEMKQLSATVGRHHTQFPGFVSTFSKAFEGAISLCQSLSDDMTNKDSSFLVHLKTILDGRSGNRGVRLAHSIIIDQEEGGQLAKRLELDHVSKFKRLTEQHFFQKFVNGFMLEINTLAVLSAYSKVDFIRKAMKADGLDTGRLRELFDLLNQAFEQVHIELVLPRLFTDQFKNDKHLVGQDSNLIYHFRSQINELSVGTIYDITKTGIITRFPNGENLDTKPRVIYKTE